MVKPVWNKSRISIFLLLIIFSISDISIAQEHQEEHRQFTGKDLIAQNVHIMGAMAFRKERNMRKQILACKDCLSSATSTEQDSLNVHFPEFRGEEPEVHFLKRRHIVLFGGIIVTSWTAFWLRDRANDYYDRYSVAKRQKDIKNYWRKTQQFDTMANISLGISGILFAYLVKDLL